MIKIRSDYNVQLVIENVDELKPLELFNIAYKELGVYIDHNQEQCLVKIVKNKKFNDVLVNDYLNKGIYPFYKIMLSNLHAHKKIEIVKEIFHYLQIKDFMFFESIEEALEVYKFNSQRNINKTNTAQEMFALKAVGIDLLEYHKQDYNDVIPKIGIVDNDGFKNLIGFINNN